MENGRGVGAHAFAAWGRFVHRRRWWVLALSLLVLAGSVGGLLQGGELNNAFSDDMEAARAAKVLEGELPHEGGSSFWVVFSSPSWTVDDPRFRAALEASLAPLEADRRVREVATPYAKDDPRSSSLVSRDGHRALAVVTIDDDFEVARNYYPQLRALIASDSLEVHASGNLAINHDFDVILQDDLVRAEIVSLPLSLVILFLVFGTLVAALLPVAVGVLAIVGGLGGVFLLSRITDVSQYSLNIVTLIGLGVAIDYSLFIVSRYREELAAGRSVSDAIATTMATAGRATLFSGLTVAIGLAGLLFFEGTFLASMGLAGAVVVGFAVFYGFTFLPALLSILGRRVENGRLPFRRPREGRGGWRALATWVMRRPVLVLLPTLALVLAAGMPFLDIRLANGDVTMLPEHAESREGWNIAVDEFPDRDQTRMTLLVRFPDGDPLSAERTAALHDHSRWIASLPDVLRVQSVVDLDPALGKDDYVQMYLDREGLPPPVQSAIRESVGAHVVALSVLTGSAAASDEARALLETLRSDRMVADGEVLVTGQTAFDVDSIAFILERVPHAIAFVVLVTYLLIFVQVRSLVIPLKAVVMNLVSVCAAFGALVWVFQQGNLSDLLNFTPTSLDPTIPVILFCIVFGLSMDYEVLLLSRMHEEYLRTRDNTRAVAEGLERSGRLITGAAAIMFVVFGAFALADVVIIKAIGFGLAVAILIDATLAARAHRARPDAAHGRRELVGAQVARRARCPAGDGH